MTRRDWDGRGRLVSAGAGADIGVDWGYDSGDRRTSATRRHANLNSSSYNYDENDRLTELLHLTGEPPEAPPGGSPVIAPTFHMTFGYDPEGDRLFMLHGAPDLMDRSETYGHDNRHRLTGMQRGVASQDASGDLYIDPADRLVHPRLPGVQAWTMLDRRGNWLTFEETLEGAPRTESRTVDGANQYLTVDPDDVTGAEDLKYDLAGNLTFNHWARNVGDACLPLADGYVARECRQDANDPNSACDAANVGCGRGQEYEYDLENRLVRIRRDTDNLVGRGGGDYPPPEANVLMEFVYDALGRRIETIEYVNAATGAVLNGQSGNSPPRRTRHVYFGLEMIQECVCGGGYVSCEAGPALIREFVHGDPDRYPEVVAMLTYMHELHAVPLGEPPLPATPHFVQAYHYLHDALGSVIGLVDEAGTLVERCTYDPYGKVFIESWTWDETAEGGQGAMAWLPSTEPNSGMPYSPTGNPFGFTGHVYLPAVGLYHAKHRILDPIMGRWLQRDPIEYAAGSMNLYEYVYSSPLSWIDPFGLEPTSDEVDDLLKGNPRGSPLGVPHDQHHTPPDDRFAEKLKDAAIEAGISFIPGGRIGKVAHKFLPKKLVARGKKTWEAIKGKILRKKAPAPPKVEVPGTCPNPSRTPSRPLEKMGHARKHADDFRVYDPKLTNDDIANILEDIVKTGSTSPGAHGATVYTGTAAIGGKQLTIKVVVSSGGVIKTGYPITY